MIIFPNQKNVTVHRDLPKKGEGNFLQIKKENMFDAYKELDHNGYTFALYIYLASNADDYTFNLSPRAVFIQMGMPETTVRDQIKKLIEKGYLVPKEEGSSRFDFYEKLPSSDEK